jgi:ArsR family transcriptional regulator
VLDAAVLDAAVTDEGSSLAVLQAVADPVRWTIMHTLAARPSCVCNLQEHVPIAANLLSYHLKVLREAGLVTSSKRGRWVDYALAPDASARMRAALPDVLDGSAACATADAPAGAASR